MQLLLPIFPLEARLINPIVGVYEKESIVNYILTGIPLHHHHKDDLQNFRWITAKLVVQNICKQTEIAKFFGVSEDSVFRSVKRLREKGESDFFKISCKSVQANKT